MTHLFPCTKHRHTSIVFTDTYKSRRIVAVWKAPRVSFVGLTVYSWHNTQAGSKG